MSDYTPSEARVCIDFCNAAIKRPKPDGSVMTMEEADAAFTRFLAEKRAEWEAEQGKPEWEYGVRFTGGPDRLDPPEYIYRWPSLGMAEDQAALNPEHEAEFVRRRKAGPWLPVPDTTNHESEG